MAGNTASETELEQIVGFTTAAKASNNLRELAEHTSSSMQEVSDLVANVQNGVAEAVKAMEQQNFEASSEYAIAMKVGNTLGAIQTAVNEFSEQVNQISSALEGMDTDWLAGIGESTGSPAERNALAEKEITQPIEPASGVSGKSSAPVGALSSATEEMSSQLQELVTLSESLKMMASRMHQSIAMYETG